MTNENAQTPVYATGHSAQDLLYGEAVILANRRAPSENRLTTFNIRDKNGAYRRDVIGWELAVFDLSGGLDQQYGPISNRMASMDGMDMRWSRTGVLSPLVNSATSPDPTSIQVISSVDVFDETAIGIGGGANVSLLHPTSATNWAPAAITYSPGSAITYLHRGAVGGTTAQLWVCKAGGNVEVLSDLTSGGPTSAGSIGSTNPCWGVIESPINESTPGAVSHIMSVGATIVIKTSDSTLTTAPDNPAAGATTWHGGGYPVHPQMFAIGKGRLSAFWVKPRTHRTSSMLSVTTALGDIWYMNAYGGDPLPLNLPIPARLARKWRNGIVASDHRSVYWHNGNIENLHYAYEREPVTEREYLVGDMFVDRDRLYVWTIERDVSADAPTRICKEEYIPETDAWYQVTGWISVSGGQGDIIPSVTGVVAREHSTVYRNTAAYIYDDASWRYVQLTPPDWNPYYMSRNTGSATAGVVYPFATSGSAKSAVWPLPGLEGFPSVVYEVQCLGELKGTFAAGTYPLRVDIARQTTSGMSFDSAGTHSPTFTFSNDDVAQWQTNVSRNLENQEAIDKLQIRLTMTQGSDSTRKSSQGLPLIIRGVTFLDRKIKPLQSVLLSLPEAS